MTLSPDTVAVVTPIVSVLKRQFAGLLSPVAKTPEALSVPLFGSTKKLVVPLSAHWQAATVPPDVFVPHTRPVPVQSVPATQVLQPVPSAVQTRTVLPWQSVVPAEVQPAPARTPTGRQRQALLL